MANTVLTTEYHRANMALKFILDLATTPYYMFLANHTDPVNSSIADVPNDSVANSFTDVYRNMIAGKAVSANTAKLAVRSIPYEANTVYAMYDDQEANLHLKDFYVVVDASSYKHVFKCLDNNMNTVSTVIPDFSDVTGSNTHLYQTSDGYRWKYMYTYTSADAIQFETPLLIPVVANSEVSLNSTAGSIDIVKIIDVGRRYNNYVTGTFRSQDVTVNGDDTLFAVSNASIQTVNGYYTGCLLYLSSGTGAGQYKEVVDYVSNPNGNFLVVNSAFTITPTNGTEFEVYPKVKISGAGDEIVNAEARALVNAVASNSVYRIEVLDPGLGYTYATAVVQVNSVVGVTEAATVRPILPPKGGHGYDPATELFSTQVVLTTTFSNTQSNTIPATNFYRQVGLIKSPLFQDVTLGLTSTVGTFLPGEIILNITTRLIKTGAVVSLGNNVLTSNVGDFTKMLSNGENVIIGNDDLSSFQFLGANTVTNSSQIVLTSNVNFSASNASIYLTNAIGAGVISTVQAANNISTLAIDPSFVIGSQIIGQSTGSMGQISTVSRSGENKDYTTFVQLNKYVGSLTFGVFEPNEVVYQGNSTATLHSSKLNSGVLTLYTSNQIGSFQTSNTINGNTSTAIMAVTAKYKPELVFGSGTPIHIENLVSPITREPDQSETFKIVLNF